MCDLTLVVSTAPPLGPVGAGGWHFEDEVTDEMRVVAKQAEEMYSQSELKDLTPFNKEYLTNVTLHYYIDPISPKHLVNALKRRAAQESVLTCREPILLGSSFRVIGWDGMGASVIASEPSMFKKSICHVLNQTEYTGWSAMDMNKPGAHGVSIIMDFGGGFSARHFLDVATLKEIASLVEGQWRRRLKVVLLVDIPRVFQSILNMFLAMLKENTRNKIRCVSLGAAIEELVAMGCDGETVSYSKSYMANRRRKSQMQTYHPIVDYSWFRERLAALKLSQDSEYLIEEAHLELRSAIQEFRVQKWGIPEAVKRTAFTP